MKWESYNFTDDFQDTILACLIRHPDKFFGFGQIIKPAFFNGPEQVQTVFHLIEYHKEYSKYANFTTLGNYAFFRASRNSVDQANKIVEYVAKLSDVDTTDWKGVLDLCISFAKERAVYDGLRKIHAAQSEGKMEKINAVEVMEEALRVGTDYNNLGKSLYHDSGEVIDIVTKRDYGVMTGYPDFDRIWKFGWAPGWLIVPLAPPKRYKTAFCINLAMNMACKLNTDVLYYACEISQELAMMRAIYNLTGYTEEQVFRSPKKIKPLVDQKLKEKMFGNVWFKGFPAKSTSLSQIRDHAKQTIQIYGLNPKAIFIDYAETVKPDKVDKTVPDWRQQADIYIQARAMGAELGCAIIMPDRCNKDTVGRSVPSMKSFQGSFEKAGVVDVAIGLCADDGEHQQNRVRYFIFLNRHGEAMKHFAGRVEPQLMRMTVDKEIDYNPDEEEEDNKSRRRRGGGGESLSGPPRSERQRKAKRDMNRDAEMTQAD
jgi:replicative DNA helicase